MRKTTI